MKRSVKMILVGVVAAVGVGLFSGCGHWHKTPEEHAEYMVKKVTKKLDLNEDQVGKLNKLKSEMLTVGRDFQQEHEQAHESILAMLDQSTLDQTMLLGLITAKTQVVNDKAPQVVAAMGEFYDSLNPEQQAELREHFKNKMEHRRGHWH